MEKSSYNFQDVCNLVSNLNEEEKFQVISLLQSQYQDYTIAKIMDKIKEKFSIKDFATDFVFRYTSVYDKDKDEATRLNKSVTFKNIKSFDELETLFSSWYKSNTDVDRIVNVWISYTEEQQKHNKKYIAESCVYLSNFSSDGLVPISLIVNNIIKFILTISNTYCINCIFYNIDTDEDGKMYISNKVTKTSKMPGLDEILILS